MSFKIATNHMKRNTKQKKQGFQNDKEHGYEFTRPLNNLVMENLIILINKNFSFFRNKNNKLTVTKIILKQ